MKLAANLKPVIARIWHGVLAALVVAAVAVQLVIALKVADSPHAVSTGVLRGSSTAGRVIRVLSFFTIQSNLLTGLVSAQLALLPNRDGRVFRPLRLAALFGITVTGIVYSTVLAKIHQPHGTAETFVNDLVHYVIPAMTVLGWVAYGPRPRIDRRCVALSLIFPFSWISYTVIRGAIWKWYPYPFVDVATHGYAQVALNGALVLILLAGVAAMFAFGDRRLPIAPPGTDAEAAG